MRILHFDIDSLRPDHLGCYGYTRPTSPNIDRVAAEGMRFDHCFVSDSPCMPSRAAFLTGRFGIHNHIVTHGEQFNAINLPQHAYGGPFDKYRTLPLALRHAGLDAFSFSTFPVRHMASWFGLGWSGMFTPSLEWGGEYAEEVGGHVLDWLRKNPGRDGYFMHVNLWDPHRIYKDDLHEWASRFRGLPPARDFPTQSDIDRHQSYTGPFTANGQGDPPTRLMPDAVHKTSDLKLMVDGYDAMIAYTDHHVGLILDELERQGVLDETAIVITADHGDAFGEHGIYSDHVCAHDPVHRVPLIVRWPGVTTPGSSSDELIYQLDWTATLADLAGKRPEGWQGVSLADHLRGGDGPGRDTLFLTHGLYTLQRAARTRNHLLLRTLHAHEYGHFDPMMLYDLRHDPHLTRNIAEAQPAVAADLTRRLDGWERQMLGLPHADGDPLRRVLQHREAKQ